MSAPTTDTLSARVFPRLYRDSVTLMALAAEIEKLDGVTRVGAVMGTPANMDILERSHMRPSDLDPAPDDLVLVVQAADPDVTKAALDAAEAGLESVDQGAGPSHEVAPATVDEGLAADPELTVAAVSTAGTHAPVVVEQALRKGLHVFCFSDNISVEDEVRLKRLAVDQGLLLMGPDCGTAILDGVPLGFANVVRPGPVAIVAASGTGAQEVSRLLDDAGTGVSQIIGVGGRDLSHEVGGVMTAHALDLVAADPATTVVVVVSKPPAAEVADRLLERLATLGKPAVACLLGVDDVDGDVLVRGTLEGGAVAAAALAGHPSPLAGTVPASTTGPGLPAPTDLTKVSAGILGLYTGGTLAGEAEVVLRRAGHTAEILDLGADEYTTGRPHPMIDPSSRVDQVVRAGSRTDIGIVLVDVVLGHGASADPATPLVEALASARVAAAADGREIVVLGSICGTATDPQSIDAQRRILEQAGVLLHPSNAAAARHAAALTEAVLSIRARPGSADHTDTEENS